MATQTHIAAENSVGVLVFKHKLLKKIFIVIYLSRNVPLRYKISVTHKNGFTY